MIKKMIRLAKKLLSVTWVRRAYEGTTRTMLEVGAANRVTATVYSLPGLLTFNREQFAVLRGRRDYYRNLQQARQSHVELRRNVHRLEKGMSMRPRRPVFAKDYIEETVDFYVKAVHLEQATTNSAIDHDEMVWANNVLMAYFEAVDSSDPLIAKVKKKFASAAQVAAGDGSARPFARSEGVRSEVRYDDLLQLAHQRRSVRWFQDTPVPRELIDKAMLVGRQSPTACNRLPYEYLVFDDPALVQKVATIPSGSGGYNHQIPTVIVVKGNLDAYFSPRDRHVIYIDAALSAMAFMYALETLGLASSVINWPDFEPLEATMARRLDLKPSERVIMLIAVGFPDPDGVIPYSAKKSLDVLRRFNPISEQ